MTPKPAIYILEFAEPRRSRRRRRARKIIIRHQLTMPLPMNGRPQGNGLAG